MNRIIIEVDMESMEELRYNMGVTLERAGIKTGNISSCLDTLIDDLGTVGIELKEE